MGQGKLVTLEGIDGSGKTTVATILVAEFARRGVDVVPSREPTDGFLGEALKRQIRREDANPVAEAFLFVADHLQHVQWVRQQLAAGRTVLSDRYSDSCYAYQGAGLADVPVLGPRAMDWLIALQEPFNRPPDVVLLLDLDPEKAVARVRARGEVIKFEEPGFLGRVRENYRKLAQRSDAYEVVPADRPAAEVAADCLARLERRGVLPTVPRPTTGK
ncbi:MAG TPA: dTMP kinase [Candidatus Thermoplasmatota archaeon]|nr:dTMP kinase [Candidatus Thermoplasmatota archaeon]